jgi:hypothetical protein
MPGPDTELNRMCRKVGDVVEVLPNGLSEKARKEIAGADQPASPPIWEGRRRPAVR